MSKRVKTFKVNRGQTVEILRNRFGTRYLNICHVKPAYDQDGVLCVWLKFNKEQVVDFINYFKLNHGPTCGAYTNNYNCTCKKRKNV